MRITQVNACKAFRISLVHGERCAVIVGLRGILASQAPIAFCLLTLMANIETTQSGRGQFHAIVNRHQLFGTQHAPVCSAR